MIRRLLILTLIFGSIITDRALGQKFNDLLPKRHYVIPGFSADSIHNDLARRPLHHIEGEWSFPGTGVRVAISAHTPDNIPSASHIDGYRIILLTAPNRSLRPGTVLGHVTSSAVKGKYDARMYTSISGLSLSGPKHFTLTLDETENRIVFQKRQSSYSINLWRLLPYLFRNIVRKNETEQSIAGCVRVFPAPSLPLEPVYL